MTKKKLVIGIFCAAALVSAMSIGCSTDSASEETAPKIAADSLTGEFTVVSDPGAGVAGETNIYCDPVTGKFYVNSQKGYFLESTVVTKFSTIFGDNGVTAPDKITFDNGSPTAITIMQDPTVDKVNNLLGITTVTLGSTVTVTVGIGKTLDVSGKTLNLGSGAKVILRHATASGPSSGKLEMGGAGTLSATAGTVYTGTKALAINNGYVGGSVGLRGLDLQALGFDNIDPVDGKHTSSLTPKTGYDAADITITGGILSTSALFQSSNYIHKFGLTGTFTVVDPPALANSNAGEIAYFYDDTPPSPPPDPLPPPVAKLYRDKNEAYFLDSIDDAELIAHLNAIWQFYPSTATPSPPSPLIPGIAPGDQITFDNGIAALFTLTENTTVTPPVMPSAPKVSELLKLAPNVVLDQSVILTVVGQNEVLEIPPPPPPPATGDTSALRLTIVAPGGAGAKIVLKDGGILKTGAASPVLTAITATSSMTIGFIDGDLVVPGNVPDLGNAGFPVGTNGITTIGQTFTSLQAPQSGTITIIDTPILFNGSTLRALTNVQ